MLKTIPFILLTLLLGFKHSYDADHVIAVSSILRKVRSMKNALKIGISWAIGHMLTASIVTILLFYFRESILSIVLPHFEKIVGAMLIVLGIFGLKDFFPLHLHKHKHGKIMHSHPHMHLDDSHSHKHMLGIGIIHGLASNDELILLFTASFGITTIGGILLGIGFFSVGVIIGMLLFSALFAWPLVKANSSNVYRWISLLTGVLSIAYGAFALI